METEKKLTGYPSIDKPWLKHYKSVVCNLEIPHKTLYQYIYEGNMHAMGDTALRYYGNKITYGMLFENIKSIAKFFIMSGISSGDIVTIMSTNTPETIYAYYGLNYIGATANMVYMTLSGQEILSTIMETKSKMLLALDIAIPQIESIRKEIKIPIVVMRVRDSMPFALRAILSLKETKWSNCYLEYTKCVKKAQKVELPACDTHDQRVAVIVYTSGTTGKPKGVMLSSYNINAVVYQYKYSGMHFRRGETYLNIIPLFLAYGVSMLQLAISMGIDTTLLIDVNSKKVAKEFNKLKPNHFASGPGFLDDLMRYVKGDLSSLINFTGGGGALSLEKEAELNQFLLSHGAKVKYTIGYGMTELSASVAACNNEIYKSGSMGIPLPKSIVKIVCVETGNELSIGQVGEICFNAPNMMLGYYHNQEATDEIICSDENGMRWIHTGDLGLIDEEGFLFFKGKMKRIYIVKKDGHFYKMFPQRIEEFFEEYPCVEKCAVIAVEDDESMNVPVAFVTNASKTENMVLIEKLKQKAKKDLPKHMQPSQIFVVDKIPLTSSGKIDYQLLEERRKSIDSK